MIMKHHFSGSPYRVTSMFLASMLCASSLPVLTVVAQESATSNAVNSTVNQQRVYDIPAGSLADTLNRFAVASGVSITFDPQQIPSQQSTGLKGKYRLDEGFESLLRDTGFEARYHAATNSYRLEKALPKGILPTVRVESTTEGTGSYTTGLTNTATRLDLSIRETPQSITVITRQQIEDQGLEEISESLDQTVGLVLSSSGPIGSDNNMIYARGFPLENYQVDGVARSTRFGFQNDIADMAIFDRVEVVRGASGLLNGVGEPSGAVNLVRKLPTTEFQAYVLGKYGSWDHQRLEGDVSGPLTESGNLRGRLVVAWQDNEEEMERLAMQKNILYGVLEGNVADSTILSVGVEYQKHESMGGDRFGSPIYYPDGTLTHYTASTNLTPDWGFHLRENLSLFSTLEHYFDNGWRIKLDLEKSRREYDSLMPSTLLAGAWGDNDDLVYAGRWSGDPEQDSVNLHAVGTYQLFGRTHDLVVGGSYARLEENNPYYNEVEAPIDDLDVLIKTGDFTRLDVGPLGEGNEMYEEQSGAYIATRLKPVDSVSIILGSRFSNWETRSDYIDVEGNIERGETSKESGVVTPYAGIVFDLTHYLSLYASYTDIFKPATVYDLNGALLDPAEGSNMEVGAKLSFYDDKLNLHATYYKTQQDNVPEYVPGPGGAVNRGPTGHYVYEGIDGTETTGYELEISGQLATHWQVGGGYADNDPRHADGSRRLTHVAQKTFKFFTHYNAVEWLDGLSLGANLRWLDGTVSDWTGYEQGSVTVVDLMARYQFSAQLAATLNINNLFDKTYYTSIRNEGWFGESRNAYLTLRYNF